MVQQLYYVRTCGWYGFFSSTDGGQPNFHEKKIGEMRFGDMSFEGDEIRRFENQRIEIQRFEGFWTVIFYSIWMLHSSEICFCYVPFILVSNQKSWTRQQWPYSQNIKIVAFSGAVFCLRFRRSIINTNNIEQWISIELLCSTTALFGSMCIWNSLIRTFLWNILFYMTDTRFSIGCVR